MSLKCVRSQVILPNIAMENGQSYTTRAQVATILMRFCE